jgi:phosphoribosylanthranilate isomerase
MPRVKICGITSVEDARAAIEAGADALGLVFYAPSPRSVNIAQALEISRVVGPFVTLVGLFVNADVDEVEKTLSQVPLHVLQFHGDESRDYCEQFQRPYMKAIRMRPDLDIQQAMSEHPNASGLLLDAYRKGVPGGTGETFDWQRVPTRSKQALVLAGGLTADNLEQALAATHVWGVDVSGGVEQSPGRKDHEALKRFVSIAKHQA